ncbi:hypothetical protein Tco_0563381 [Tanacetum coccineum]
MPKDTLGLFFLRSRNETTRSSSKDFLHDDSTQSSSFKFITVRYLTEAREFLNKTLHAYFKETEPYLVEVARMMLSALLSFPDYHLGLKRSVSNRHAILRTGRLKGIFKLLKGTLSWDSGIQRILALNFSIFIRDHARMDALDELGKCTSGGIQSLVDLNW